MVVVIVADAANALLGIESSDESTGNLTEQEVAVVADANEQNIEDGAPKTKKVKTKKVRELCLVDECSNFSVTRGVCGKHGGRPKPSLCSHEGCTNKVINSGVCVRHGAWQPECKHEGCTNRVINSGVCIRHGAKQAVCSQEGCTNYACSKGVCRKHGENHHLCLVESCQNQALRGGVCQRHGARPKACRVEGCTNQTKRGGGAFRCCYEYSSDVMFGSRFFSSFNSPPN